MSVATIGFATMKDDGTIVLDLIADNGAGMRGEARLVYPPDHPQYHLVLDHLGGLRPGEHKPVKPWSDCDPPAGVPRLDSFSNIEVNARYWVDMAWQGHEWAPAEPIPMPYHHATRLELTNLSTFPSLVGQQSHRVRFTIEITASEVRPAGGVHPQWRATHTARVIDICVLE